MDGAKIIYWQVCLIIFINATSSAQKITAIYPADNLTQVIPGGGLKCPGNTLVSITLVGDDLFEQTKLFFTTSNSSCDVVRSTAVLSLSNSTNASAVVEVLFYGFKNETFWYICLILNSSNSRTPIQTKVHQGSHEWLKIDVYLKIENAGYRPLQLIIDLEKMALAIICCVLLLFSGLFSGLTLGLMSLDLTDLRIIEKGGSEREKMQARKITKLRRKGYLLLCTLVLGNVLVNNTFTIIINHMTNWMTTIVLCTFCITIFGEIVPQAICARYGLSVGANTYCITLFFIYLAFPVTFPISVLLDLIFGKEVRQAFNKQQLQELIKLNADQQMIHGNETNIISGALLLTSVAVEDVMTKIEDVYMLELGTILDFELITDIIHEGYTRIPVYDGVRSRIISLLNTKELALIDPDDKTPLSSVCMFYDHRPLFIGHDVTLDVMLQAFLKPGCSHMAVVQKQFKTGNQDSYFENVGIITLEDVIEEILQSEIVDETDQRVDNRHRGSPPLKAKENYALLVPEAQKSRLPQQLAFAAFQFLSSLEPFSEAHMARSVLKTLMKNVAVVNLPPGNKPTFIYQKGTPSDKFVLILQGTVEVEIGREKLVFENGPFSYFGVEFMKNCIGTAMLSKPKIKDFTPDFTVRATSDVQYLYITRLMYVAALRTSRRLHLNANIIVSETFNSEYKKAKLNENHSSHDSEPECSPPFLTAPTNNESLVMTSSTASHGRQIFFRQTTHDPFRGLSPRIQTDVYAGGQSCDNQAELYISASEQITDADSIVVRNGSTAKAAFSVGDSVENSLLVPAYFQDKDALLVPAYSQGKNPQDASEIHDEIAADKRNEATQTVHSQHLNEGVPDTVWSTLELTEPTAGGDVLFSHSP